MALRAKIRDGPTEHGLRIPVTGQKLYAIGSQNEMRGVDASRVILVKKGSVKLALVVALFGRNFGRLRLDDQAWKAAKPDTEIRVVPGGCTRLTIERGRSQVFLGFYGLFRNVQIGCTLQQGLENLHLHIALVIENNPVVIYVHDKGYNNPLMCILGRQ